MNTYISSDHHFYHRNIIKYDRRPFTSLDEMHEIIIENHNSIVKHSDEFYFLGDFGFGTKEQNESILKHLNGRKFFIKGNHDKKDAIDLYYKYGIYLGEQKMIKIKEQRIVLNHFSMNVWDGSHRGSWHLYGHSHGSLPDNPNSKSMDVGIMLNNYFPFSFEEIKERLDKKIFIPVDDHK